MKCGTSVPTSVSTHYNLREERSRTGDVSRQIYSKKHSANFHGICHGLGQDLFSFQSLSIWRMNLGFLLLLLLQCRKIVFLFLCFFFFCLKKQRLYLKKKNMHGFMHLLVSCSFIISAAVLTRLWGQKGENILFRSGVGELFDSRATLWSKDWWSVHVN